MIAVDPLDVPFRPTMGVVYRVNTIIIRTGDKEPKRPMVVIEVPPMAAVVDYKMIARHCDRFVFVVEWGKTSQRMVLECLDNASAFRDRIVGIVLNKVDPSSLRSIEHYKGERFHDYYSDEKR